MTLPSEPGALYPLLPAVYRIADAEQGEPLRALLQVLEGPYRAVGADIEALYDDWFVETCASALVPWVGDLVGVAHTLDPRGAIPTFRARVANALAYARRKGPAWVLARAAADVTGWPARAVEYFRELGQTQDLADVRPGVGRTADLRLGVAMEAGTPFDRMARTVEVRGGDTAGRWAADRVGLFFWRLRSYPLTDAEPRAVGSGCFTLCPLGADTPLFLPPRTAEPFGEQPGPWDVPAPVSRELLVRVLEEAGRPGDPWNAGGYPVLRVRAGTDAALSVVCGLVAADLEGWRVPDLPVPADPHPAPRAAVDPARGRIAFLDGARPAWVRAEWSYGFGADLGGGPYPRPAAGPAPGPGVFVAQVGRAAWLTAGAVRAATLADALERWAASPAAEGVVRLAESAVHPAPAGVVEVPDGRRLWIVAAPGQRPCLRGDLHLRALGGAGVVLEGLLLDGTVRLAGALDLSVLHCTVAPPVPGAQGEPRRSVLARADFAGSVTVSRSVLGPLSVPGGAAGVALADSIVAGGVYALAQGSGDADAGPAAALQVERCTVFGVVWAHTLWAADSIFVDPVLLEDPGSGGLVCCYAPPGVQAPCTRCQPAPDGPPVRPLFTSTRYGDAAFAQLDTRCAAAIRTGAADGAEMGAFHLLDNPRRQANLRAAVAEFLPNGLEAVVSYVT